MTRPLRLLGALAATVALTAAGLVTTTAQAASTAMVAGTVVDAADNPIRGITVWGFDEDDDDDDGWFAASTNSAGQFKTSHGQGLSTGDWQFIFVDQGGDYAQTSTRMTLVAGPNAVTAVTMQMGGHVAGTLTAPSGQKLKNVDLYAENRAADEDDDLGGGGYDTTDADGSFELGPLEVGTFGIYTGFEPEDTDASFSFDITTPGEKLAPLALADVKVRPALRLTATSPSKRRAKVRIAVGAGAYGIATAGGKFDLYDGARKIRAGYSLTNDRRTLTVSGLTKGTHSLRFRYLGGVDTLKGWSPRIKLKVI